MLRSYKALSVKVIRGVWVGRIASRLDHAYFPGNKVHDRGQAEYQRLNDGVKEEGK